MSEAPAIVVRRVPVGDLRPDPENAREHSRENIEAIRSSLQRFGQQRPLVVRPDGTIIAGNGTFLAALELGWTAIDVATFDGSPDEARAFAIVDNRTAELAAWNAEVLEQHLNDLARDGWDLQELGFPEDWSPWGEGVEQEVRSYTREVGVPQYEPVGEEPSVGELLDTTRADELRARIAEADLEPEVRAFLNLAATRHVVYDYRKAAEFYPHAPPEVQRLMEESALVIIDLEDAIRLGYVRFADAIAELIEEGKRGDAEDA